MDSLLAESSVLIKIMPSFVLIAISPNTKSSVPGVIPFTELFLCLIVVLKTYLQKYNKRLPMSLYLFMSKFHHQ
jgi:hypothetical protein